MKKLTYPIAFLILLLANQGCTDLDLCPNGRTMELIRDWTPNSPDLLNEFQYYFHPVSMEHSYSAVWEWNNVCPDGLIILDAAFAYIPAVPMKCGALFLLYVDDEQVNLIRSTQIGKSGKINTVTYLGKAGTGKSNVRIRFEIKYWQVGITQEQAIKDYFQECKIEMSFVLND